MRRILSSANSFRMSAGDVVGRRQLASSDMQYVTVYPNELEFAKLSRHHRFRPPIWRRMLNNMKTLSAIGRTSLLSLATFGFLVASSARAQLLEQVDVSNQDQGATVVVRFAAPVQYLRHTPPSSGRTLRVYVQVTGRGMQPGDMVPITLRSQGNARVPRFSAKFPDTGNALVLEFDREVHFEVGPGPDGRSIILSLPAAGK